MPDSSASHYNVGVEKKSQEHATPWAVESDSPSQKKPGAVVSDTFLLPDYKRPTVKHDEFTDLEIPVIDLAAAFCNCDGDDVDVEGAMESVVTQVRDACLNWGFFQIINHGIDEELLARVQSQAHLFFNLPYEEKVKVSKPPGKFAGYGHATVKEGDVRPWSEGFYFTDVESTAEMVQKLWPPGSNNDFVDSYSEYNDEVRRLSGRLMQIVVAGLVDVNPAHFRQYTRSTGGLLRWNFYPACPEPLKTLGLTEHTDFNLLTVVHQGHIGGLQILKDGHWIAVRPRPGSLAVNIGDTLQVLTNSKYKSVPHRAVVNATQSRLSLVYFYVPLPSIDIVPAPELVDEQHPCQYKPFDFQSITKMKQMYFMDTLDHFRIDQLKLNSTVA